jgi:peptidoglycan/xylan/chitin deacetylase (PgdA/CDA1 family)
MGNTRNRPRSRHARWVAAAILLLLSASCSAGAGAAQADHLSSGCREGRRIALTFDDGPNPPYTGQILDILQARNAVATFFDEGQAAGSHPGVVQREIAMGMAVGSHSYAHTQDLPAMTRSGFARDLRRAEDALTPLLGARPALYRAPYGHVSENMLAALRTAGYTSIGWDLDSTDWKSAAVPDDVVRSVLDNAHPGAIVLLHDGGLGGGNTDRSATVAALPRILDGLRGRGYTFATIPELTGAPEAHGGRRRSVCSAN